MGFDPEKNAGRIHITVSTARNSGYSGNELLRLARALRENPSATEAELAIAADIAPGHTNSGVGDLKRLLLTLIGVFSGEPSAPR